MLSRYELEPPGGVNVQLKVSGKPLGSYEAVPSSCSVWKGADWIVGPHTATGAFPTFAAFETPKTGISSGLSLGSLLNTLTTVLRLPWACGLNSTRISALSPMAKFVFSNAVASSEKLVSSPIVTAATSRRPGPAFPTIEASS